MTIVVLFVVFIVLPNTASVPLVLQATTVTDDVKPLSRDSLENIRSKEMLAAHYVDADPLVPVDYPYKRIGECPYSKPQSRDLPVADIPMNVVNLSKDMRLA